jgi:hypothetical protein
MPEVNGQYRMNPQMAQAAGDQVTSDQQSAGKVSAADAEYIDTAGSCASCSKFQGDGQPCAVVSDPVSSGGWCKLYEAGQPQGNQSPDEDQSAAPGAVAPPASSAPPQGM